MSKPNLDHVPTGYKFTAAGDGHEIVYTIKRDANGKIEIHWIDPDTGAADFLDDCDSFVYREFGKDCWNEVKD